MHVFQDDKFEPVAKNERTNYQLDLTFIYESFLTSQADSINEQNKATKNGCNIIRLYKFHE